MHLYADINVYVARSKQVLHATDKYQHCSRLALLSNRLFSSMFPTSMMVHTYYISAQPKGIKIFSTANYF